MLSFLVTSKSNCTFVCLEISPSSLTWLDQAAWSTVRERWLLRKANLAPLLSAHSGAELEQVSERDGNAVPNTDGLHLSL